MCISDSDYFILCNLNQTQSSFSFALHIQSSLLLTPRLGQHRPVLLLFQGGAARLISMQGPQHTIGAIWSRSYDRDRTAPSQMPFAKVRLPLTKKKSCSHYTDSITRKNEPKSAAAFGLWPLPTSAQPYWPITAHCRCIRQHCPLHWPYHTYSHAHSYTPHKFIRQTTSFTCLTLTNTHILIHSCHITHALTRTHITHTHALSQTSHTSLTFHKLTHTSHIHSRITYSHTRLMQTHLPQTSNTVIHVTHSKTLSQTHAHVTLSHTHSHTLLIHIHAYVT